MSDSPDAKWQDLIQSYLQSLNKWQRLAVRVRPPPGEKPNPTKMKKVDKAYTQMKTAERELKDYESTLET